MGEEPPARAERLTRAREFQAVFRQGARVARPTLLVVWRESDGPRRAGFTVSRQVRRAVRRNRARRRVREAYRVNRHVLPSGIHLVIVARPRAGIGPYAEIVEDMRYALGSVALRVQKGAES